MKYFAYGSNVASDEMLSRCPGATALGIGQLLDWKFDYRLYADVQKQQGESVWGVVWDINQDHEDYLDMYEGYPDLYVKDYVRIYDINKRPIFWDVMLYTMPLLNYKGEVQYPKLRPSKYYYNTLEKGYKEFHLPLKQIQYEANEESFF